MWTRKVAALIAAAAVAVAAAALAPTAGASSGKLSLSVARSLAHKLVVKQRRERSLVFARLGDPVRRSSQRIDFPYVDRSTSDVLCKARIVVVQSGSSRNADLRGARCHGIPSDVLAFERIDKDLASDLRGDLRGKERRSIDRYRHSLSRCDRVAVPRSRRHDVKLLVAAGDRYSFFHPIRARLGDFSLALHDVHAGDPALAHGADAWDRALAVVDELPTVAANPCKAVEDWAANGFSDSTAPTDFGELEVELSSLDDENANLEDTAAHLASAGVLTRPAAVFAPAGILALVGR